MIEINKFISQFTDEKIKGIKKIGRKYFLVDSTQDKVSASIDQEPVSIGLFLGEHKKRFEASLALLDLIAKTSDRKAFVNKEAEWLFLCGRDVFEKNMVRETVKEGIVLVQNEANENLGFGLLSKKGGELLIKNILDKGVYLRSKK